MRAIWACLWGVVGMLVLAGPAHAAWIRVETDKFVVYGQGGEKSVRDYATRLNAYDQILRRFHPSTANRKPATKVQVVLVRGPQELLRLREGLPRSTAGFYTAMNEGVFAIAFGGNAGEAAGGDDLVFHEYAHHFMWENFPAAYPAWFVEGFAEYFMTTEIKPTQITVGGYNPGRAYSVLLERWVPLEDLLSRTTWQTSRHNLSAYYGQAWLLMHYMRSDPKRAAQLDTSTHAIAAGQDPVKALQEATGLTIAELTKALRSYTKLETLTFKTNLPVAPEMTVTRMPRSADDLFLDNIRLVLAPTGKVEGDLLADVRRKAASHPGDRLAETTLARAEFVMGDVAAGEAIMQRRLAAAPDDVEDLLLAGTGQLMAGIRDASKKQERFRTARPLLVKAFRLNPSDFRVLYAYTLSRSVEPGFPNENDINALIETRYLAPSVMENSFRAGMALLAKGRRDEAATLLAPVLNNPHAGEAAAQARKLLNEGRTDATEAKPTADAKPPGPRQETN